MNDEGYDDTHNSFDEKTTLLHGDQKHDSFATKSTWRLLTKRIFEAIAETIQFILSTLAAPGFFVAQCFQNSDGHYSLLAPVRKIWKTSADTRKGPDKGASRVETRRRSGSTRKPRPQTARESIHSKSRNTLKFVKFITSTEWTVHNRS